MKTLRLLLILPFFGTAAFAQASKPTGAFSRIFNHRDGTRTESWKHGDKNLVEEFTYKNNILHIKRVFVTDPQGRTRQGVIYDGKLNPLGSIQFGYDPTTDQLVEERQYNNKAQLIRRLFYPGAIKGRPEFARQFVAFTYDPDKPNAQPVQVREQVRPTRPVESDQEEFEPGIPINPGSAPAPRGDDRALAAPSQPAAAAKRKSSFFGVKKP